MRVWARVLSARWGLPGAKVPLTLQQQRRHRQDQDPQPSGQSPCSHPPGTLGCVLVWSLCPWPALLPTLSLSTPTSGCKTQGNPNPESRSEVTAPSPPPTWPGRSPPSARRPHLSAALPLGLLSRAFPHSPQPQHLDRCACVCFCCQSTPALPSWPLRMSLTNQPGPLRPTEPCRHSCQGMQGWGEGEGVPHTHQSSKSGAPSPAAGSHNTLGDPELEAGAGWSRLSLPECQGQLLALLRHSKCSQRSRQAIALACFKEMALHRHHGAQL